MSKYGYSIKFNGRWYMPGEDVPDDVPTEAVSLPASKPVRQMTEEEAILSDIADKPIIKKPVAEKPKEAKKPKGRPKKA